MICLGAFWFYPMPRPGRGIQIGDLVWIPLNKVANLAQFQQDFPQLSDVTHSMANVFRLTEFDTSVNKFRPPSSDAFVLIKTGSIYKDLPVKLQYRYLEARKTEDDDVAPDEEAAVIDDDDGEEVEDADDPEPEPDEPQVPPTESERERMGWDEGDETMFGEDPTLDNGIDQRHPKLKGWKYGTVEEASPYAFMMHWMPWTYFKEVLIPETNRAGQQWKRSWKTLTMPELQVWLGLLLRMSTVNLGKPSAFWSTEVKQEGFHLTMDFSTMMPKHRYEELWRNMRFSRGWEHREGSEYGPTTDPHLPMRDLLDMINAFIPEVYAPSDHLCVDESMMSWVGKLWKLAGWRYIPRKPKSKGYEFKTIADILIAFDLLSSGKSPYEKNLQFHKELGQVAGGVLRMCRPWFGTARIVYGDAWFGSPVLAANLKAHGLHCIMAAKQMHMGGHFRRFIPKDLITRLGTTWDQHQVFF